MFRTTEQVRALATVWNSKQSFLLHPKLFYYIGLSLNSIARISIPSIHFCLKNEIAAVDTKKNIVAVMSY